MTAASCQASKSISREAEIRKRIQGADVHMHRTVTKRNVEIAEHNFGQPAV